MEFIIFIIVGVVVVVIVKKMMKDQQRQEKNKELEEQFRKQAEADGYEEKFETAKQILKKEGYRLGSTDLRFDLGWDKEICGAYIYPDVVRVDTNTKIGELLYICAGGITRDTQRNIEFQVKLYSKSLHKIGDAVVIGDHRSEHSTVPDWFNKIRHLFV